MNDSIRPIHFVPQMNKVKLKSRTGDKKNNKESKQGFSNHLSAKKDKDVDNKEHKQVKETCENSEHKKQNNADSRQGGTVHDFDDGCGTIIDAEI